MKRILFFIFGVSKNHGKSQERWEKHALYYLKIINDSKWGNFRFWECGWVARTKTNPCFVANNLFFFFFFNNQDKTWRKCCDKKNLNFFYLRSCENLNFGWRWFSRSEICISIFLQRFYNQKFFFFSSFLLNPGLVFYMKRFLHYHQKKKTSSSRNSNWGSDEVQAKPVNRTSHVESLRRTSII